MKIARLREEIRLGHRAPETVQSLLDGEDIGIVADGDEGESLRNAVDFLVSYEPEPAFEAFHTDILHFVGEIRNQIELEIAALHQVVSDEGATVGIKTLPDLVLDQIADQAEAGSSFLTEEKVRARLAVQEALNYEDLDIPTTFGVIYFVLKNYFHFGRVEYQPST